MPLPILTSRGEPSPEDLLRLYAKADARWAEHLAEPEEMEWGTVVVNPALARVHDANHVRVARVPAGMSPGEVVREAEALFARRGSRCAYWRTEDSALASHLIGSRYAVRRTDVMHLRRARRAATPEPVGLTVIPARASYRHVRELAQESAREVDPAAAGELAEANVMHLDDPDVEGILALKGGEAAGRAYVLAVGEVGSIEHVHVAARLRGQGIGRAIVQRAIEACARSTFRHVFVSVDPGNEVAAGMYRRMGFERVGDVVEYRTPL